LFNSLLGGGKSEKTTVRVTEVWLVNGHLTDGAYWDNEDDVFGPSKVSGGETLTTSVVFHLGQPVHGVTGWRVAFVGTARRFPRGYWAWEDRIFVAVPKP